MSAKKIINETNALGFTVGTARPIDDRSQFTTIDNLLEYTIDENLLSLYDGIETTVEETGFKYRWMESSFGLLNPRNGRAEQRFKQSFEYPEFALGGVTYTGRKFNWVLISPIVTYALIVRVAPCTQPGPYADPTGIHIYYEDIPLQLISNEIMSAVMRVSNSLTSEHEVPDKILWVGSEERVLIQCLPMFEVGTELIIKIS